MPVPRLQELLADRPYPGRGCLLARPEAGGLVLVYFLTGRSEASRARGFRLDSNGDVAVVGLNTTRHDELRHYVALARRGRWTVLGNGDQVEPLATDLAAGLTREQAWARHDFEPDPPINTSRIWVALDADDDQQTFGAASRDPTGSGTTRPIWPISELPVGSGYLLTTYAGSAEKITTAAGPLRVTFGSTDGDSLLDEVWGALSPTLRVGAFVVDPYRPGGWRRQPAESPRTPE